MKIVGIILAIVSALALLVVIFLGYMGMFSKVNVTVKEMGPYTLAYESFVGPYTETGKVFAKVYEDLKQDGIVTTNGIGIYYDDPRQVAKDKLRSDCGSVLDDIDFSKLQEIKDKYKIKMLEKRSSLVAEFPIRNSLSYAMGPMKGYQALTKAAEKQGKTMDIPYEFYDMSGKKIYYVAPIKEDVQPLE